MRKGLFTFFARIMFFAALALSLVSCGRAAGGNQSCGGDKLRVVTTIFPQYDMARAVGGDRVEMLMLVPPGSEAHTYEPSVADVAAVSGADLFIYAGGDIDPWAQSLADTVSGSGVESFSLLDALGDKETDDEHIWTSPKNDIVMLRYIEEALVRLDPDGEDGYHARADEYEKKLAIADGQLEDIAKAAAANGKTVVIADRFPFDSLFEDYGIAHAEALGGCSVGQEPSVSKVAGLIELVREDGIPYVFYIEFSEHKTADAIADAAGCGELLLHSCHNVSREDFEAGVTLPDLFAENAENLSEVLS